jgi:molecular chaperone GrpE
MTETSARPSDAAAPETEAATAPESEEARIAALVEARSVSALTKELQANADEGVKSLLEGVQLTERELLKVLEKHGVTKFEPLGEKFDPNLHQAMFELPDASKTAGTVAQVVQPGYLIGERVLRPALVAVAKGGPKPAAAEASANDNAGEPSGGAAG